jgi:hypothetical protein
VVLSGGGDPLGVATGAGPDTNASRNAVILTIVGKQAFASAGQITVVATPPGGVSDAAGDLLAADDTVFNILPKAAGIWPG